MQPVTGIPLTTTTSALSFISSAKPLTISQIANLIAFLTRIPPSAAGSAKQHVKPI
jgi:hypothetical protein